MFNKSERYINLGENSASETRNTGIWIFRENRVTELSGHNWRWVWNRPRGIMLQKGSSKKRVPILDLTRFMQAFFYGISFLLVMIGVRKMIGGQTGD